MQKKPYAQRMKERAAHRKKNGVSISRLYWKDRWVKADKKRQSSADKRADREAREDAELARQRAVRRKGSDK